MDNLINITDKLVIRSLQTKIFRLENEVDLHLRNITKLKTDSFSLELTNARLIQENEELKKHLKALDVGVAYGR